MKRYLAEALEYDIDIRRRLLTNLEQDISFQRKVAPELKVVLYKFYDFLQQESYFMLENLDTDNYRLMAIFDKYLEHNYLFSDMVCMMIKNYKIDEFDLLFL